MIKSDPTGTPPGGTPPNGTPGPAGQSVPDSAHAVGDTAQASGAGADGTTGSSDWLGEARVGGGPAGGAGAASEPKGPPMRSGHGGADREGHTEESRRGQY